MIELWRLSGAGNDFLARVAPAGETSPAQVRAWCRRGASLGADGVFVLQRLADGIAMEHYNADGGRARLCLNGTRCAARLAFHLGWADGQVVVHTGAGAIAAADRGPTEVSLTVPPPEADPAPFELEIPGGPQQAWTVTVGVPHLVVPWEASLETCPVGELGPPLRSHPRLGPEGANVHFVEVLDGHRIAIRSYERGVEAETLACGTGVLASVAWGRSTQRLDLPVRARTRGGFPLVVDRPSGAATGWALSGDARLLARCEVYEPAGTPT